MKKEKQRALAHKFHDLHKKGNFLILPNVWDTASAVIFAKTGFKAIATTSAGLAYSLGFPDGQIISLQDNIDLIKKIVSRVDIPLSVDVERGFGSSPKAIAFNIREIIQAGAIGINLEDGLPGSGNSLIPLSEQLVILKTITNLKHELDIPFFINARTDVFWLNIGSEDARLQLAIDRSNKFIDAGVDGIFIPGNLSLDVITDLVHSIDAPLNVLPSKNNYTIANLRSSGVARMSLGSGPVRSIISLLNKISSELFSQSSLDLMYKNNISYEDSNSLFQ